MEEVKVFAQLLASQYGIDVPNSLTAVRNSETSASEDKKFVYWINLLNLNARFSPITKPSGFCGTHYWCKLCNKCYSDKQKHKCIPNCVACKTLDTENCDFRHGKTPYCNDCNRDFCGGACLTSHQSVAGKR